MLKSETFEGTLRDPANFLKFMKTLYHNKPIDFSVFLAGGSQPGMCVLPGVLDRTFGVLEKN